MKLSYSMSVFLVAFAFQCAIVLAAKKDNNGGFDHRAHAVPGGPYRAPNSDANGRARVTLNGELSHSHYFNAKTGATGKIIKYQWFINGKKVCSKKTCSIRFGLGRTLVKLTVTDNTGDSASAVTHVDVSKGAKAGARLWFYRGNGWISSKRSRSMLPQFSKTNGVVNLDSANAFPAFLRGRKFSVRVLGAISFPRPGHYRFRVGCGGASCAMWIANKMILSGADKAAHSSARMYSRTTRNFEIVYRRQFPEGPPPRLTLSWKPPGNKGWSLIPKRFLSHSPSSYYPIVHAVSPRVAEVGSVIEISGSSLVNVKAVRIGNQHCAGPVQKSQFAIRCVVPGVNGPTKLYVITAAGRSNKVNVRVVGGRRFGSGPDAGIGPVGYYQPIQFAKTYLKKEGRIWRGSQLTGIAIGPDGKYYIGSLNGFVHVLTTNFGNVITDYCKSGSVGRMRSILGVAFNPAETKRLRLYASTSILYWGVKKILPYTRGWHNGEVIAMQRTKKACLARVGTVISGIPVSNHDHTVNGISFDHSGSLLVTVGGTTNSGVSTPGDPLGGVPDSPLSGAMLRAPIWKKHFDGKIGYSQYISPGTARKVRGDVFVYAAGLRNSMCHVVHSNKHIYATDNGANANFGARSTGCNSKGGVATEPDTLKKVKRGGFHGYANRNRGRFDKRQCRHRPPQKQMKGYDRHIATLESSTDGLIEYSANTFGAQMRGDLLATKFAVSGAGKVFRIQLNKKGNVQSLFELAEHSGLTAAMSPIGGLVMPRVYQGSVAVLLPLEKNPGRLVVTSVNPFRGPRRGGNRITVTGWNLKPPIQVSVGGRPCTNVGNFKKGRSLTCRAPRGSGRAPVVVKRFGKSSRSYGFEYVYLNR